jgi:hypothetical protein
MTAPPANLVFRCVQADNLPLLRLTALEVNPAFFLATHTPVALARIRGSGGGDTTPTPFSEEEFFQAFRKEGMRFLFSIVHGSTGSGKSHLIRWAYLRLLDDPPPDSKVFIIPRAGASLRQILEQIIGDTPGAFFDRLRADLSRGRAHLTQHGLRETLLDTLAQHVDPQAFRDRPDPQARLEGEQRDRLE